MITHLLLHLSLIDGLPASTIRKLYDLFLEGGYDFYSATIADFCALGFSSHTAQLLVQGLGDQVRFQQEQELIEKYKIQVTTVAEATYPALLWHTHTPPPVLYYQGSVVWNDRPALAVVGSREGNAYGRQALQTIVAPCLQGTMVLVSGGARGIDTMVHELALQEGVPTVAVLGTGLLRAYPASNKELFKQIVAEGGAVMSPFPLKTEVQPWQFPARNRVIAGIARGCFVVQAAEGSGALITAKYALNEGRNVYALPGQFDDPLSAGCHEVLQEGAQLVTKANDILKDYPGLTLVEEAQSTLLMPSARYRQKSVSTPTKISQKQEKRTGLEGFCVSPQSFDDLLEKTGKSENELKSELFELQLAGKVQQDFAGLWVAV